MRKLTKLLMFAVIALGVSFSACNNDDIQGPDGVDPKANTHVSITLKMSKSGARLADGKEDFDENYLGKWGGNDVIKTVSIYLVDGTAVSRQEFTVGTDYTLNSDGVTLSPNAGAAIKTTAGVKTVYVVVNETSEVAAWLNVSSVNQFEQQYQNIALALDNSDISATVVTSASKLAKQEDNMDLIVMTNVEPDVIDVLPNISATKTIENKDNRASVNVQRTVARAMVTLKGETGASDVTFEIPNPVEGGPSSLGTLSDITWALAQGENSLYVQQKSEFETPSYDWKPAKTDFYGQGYGADNSQKYDYSGLFETDNTSANYNGTIVPTYADYAKKDPVEDGKFSFLKGKFVLPTTHEYAIAPTDAAAYTGGYIKGNTTYVLIRATFVPAKDAFAGNGGDTYTKGQSFFVGENGKFYVSAQEVYNDTKSTKMTKYENGKVLYYAWLNPDQVPNWYNSPTLRNNIYHIHITGFKNLGTNWNPLYPEDPNKYVPPYIPNENYYPDQPTTPGTNPPVIPNPKADPDDPNYDPKEPPFIPNPEYDPEKPFIPGDNNPFDPNPEYDPKNPPVNPDPRPTPDPIVPEGGGTPITPEEPTNPIDPEDPLTTSETWMSVDVSILPWKVHSYDVDLGI